VFEKNNYSGGHARTIFVEVPEGKISLDTGFIVFNKPNYPLFNQMLTHYGVEIAPSDMAFAASIGNGWLEYNTQFPYIFTATPQNWVNPKFIKMLIDLIRFNLKARKYLAKAEGKTLAECFDEMNLGAWFRDYLMYPLGGAIWSLPISKMKEFQAKTFIEFFDNHGLLTILDQPKWYTIKNGSQNYIDKLVAAFRDKIYLDTAVAQVKRSERHIEIVLKNGTLHTFDEVIFACHADEALSLIVDPTEAEAKILKPLRYQENHIIVHTDKRFMPLNQKAWASWNYLSHPKTSDKAFCATYWMNKLQSLPTKTHIFVTLNPFFMPDRDKILDEVNLAHPVYDEHSDKSRIQLDTIQGHDRLWFCGAYQGYGFHEDGLASAVRVAEKMGLKPVWL
jgi:predicted NAD/FAD-binding protein